MPPQLTIEQLTRVLHLVEEAAGRPLIVLGTQHLGHRFAPVTRVAFDDHPPVVVKTRRPPDPGGWGQAAHLHREQAALRLLQASDVCPDLLGIDDNAGVVVMSDVGSASSLESILRGGDPTAATRAIREYGATLGRLHAVSYGRFAEYDALRWESGSPIPLDDRLGLWTGISMWGAIEAATRKLRLPEPRAARTDVDWLRSRLGAEGPWVGLTHGDPSPTNSLCADGHVRLVDFEGSGFRHVGFDVAWIHFPFANYSADWAVLPADVVDSVDRRVPRRTGARVPCSERRPRRTRRWSRSAAAARSRSGPNGSSGWPKPVRARTTRGDDARSSPTRSACSSRWRVAPDA